MLKAMLGQARRLYEWVESLAGRPAATPFLGLISALESIFFPIPPDVILIPMCVARPRRSLFYAGVCLVGSIAGAVAGYWIGATMMDTIGYPIVDFYGLREKMTVMFTHYNEWDAWIVLIAGFTPIPYKLITLTSGAAGVNFLVFLTASVISRGARFFLVAGLIAFFGDRAAQWIDRHFDTLTIVFVILLIGFIVVATV